MHDKALIFDIKRDATEDGPGIRTTVFFKGCPLACIWCHNPEGLGFHPETNVDGEQIGTWMGLDELLYRLLQDKPFFEASGGGVTLSGGEATAQMAFASRLLHRLKEEGIHTAVETNGYFSYERFRDLLLPWLDLIYFDIKLIDAEASQQYCGHSNMRILENFTRLVREAEIPVIPRIPLVPGITTTEENLRGIAAFLTRLGVKSCSLMPYNPIWSDKVAKLGRAPKYRNDKFMTPEELRACAACFTS